jgi:tRNA(Ile)-lysidine synthase
MDEAVAGILAAGAEIDPAGYLWLDPAALAGVPVEVGRRVLARCMMAVGGGGYAPRSERLNRLYDQIGGGGLASGATLAGCQIRGIGGGRSRRRPHPRRHPGLGRALCSHFDPCPAQDRAIAGGGSRP